MPTIEEKIEEIENEIKETPYNKATQHHIGKLKAKLAELRETLIKKRAKKSFAGFSIKKTGDATVVLVGFPSVGKSTLLNKLTDASSKTAEYDFTTLNVIPGMMNLNGARIQVLDIPGIISGASSGKGRGKEVLSIVRNADLILILLDVLQTEQLYTIEKELYEAGIRMNEKPPKVRIKKTTKGGISVVFSRRHTRIDQRTVREILSVNGIHNAIVTIHDDINDEQFIDAVMGNRVYIPGIIALNKIDVIDSKKLKEIRSKIGRETIPISAEKGTNLDRLRNEIFRRLHIMRIYMKPQGREPDFKEPLIVKKGSTVGDVCEKLHKDFKKRFRYAIIWGKSARFKAQKTGFGHVLEDGDVLSIVTKR